MATYISYIHAAYTVSYIPHKT